MLLHECTITAIFYRRFGYILDIATGSNASLSRFETILALIKGNGFSFTDRQRVNKEESLSDCREVGAGG